MSRMRGTPGSLLTLPTQLKKILSKYLHLLRNMHEVQRGWKRHKIRPSNGGFTPVILNLTSEKADNLEGRGVQIIGGIFTN